MNFLFRHVHARRNIWRNLCGQAVRAAKVFPVIPAIFCVYRSITVGCELSLAPRIDNVYNGALRAEHPH